MKRMKASSETPLDLHILEMDQQSLKSVKDGAEAFMKQESRLDLLINNAGVRLLTSASTQVLSLFTSSSDHGSPFQTYRRWLRNTMANQSPCPLPTHQNITPTPRINRHFQRVQNPCPYYQPFSGCSYTTACAETTGLDSTQLGTRDRSFKRMVCHSPFILYPVFTQTLSSF